MAVINHTKKWIFLMEPHTASRAVAAALVTQAGGANFGHHHMDTERMVQRDRQMISPKKLAEYTIISTVRNPFDMLITRWKASSFKNTELGVWVRE